MSTGEVEIEPSIDTRLELSPRRRLYYGWVMLPVALAGVVVTSPGQTFGIAAFSESFRTSLELTHSQLTGAYMLGTLLAALPMTYLGVLMDRHGLRKTTAVVIVLLGIACLLVACAQGLFTLFCGFFLLRFLGPGAMSLLSSSTLAFWFDRRLGAVEGVRQMGMAGAIAVVPALNLSLIGYVGWRGAYAVLGLLVCAVMLPLLALVFRNRPEDVGQRMDGRQSDDEARAGVTHVEPAESGITLTEATRTRSFWIILFINSVWAMVGTAVTFSIVPIFQAQGLSDMDAASFLGVFALSMAVTHLAGGLLADRVPLHLLLVVATGCMAGAMVALDRLTLPWVQGGCGAAMGVAQALSTGITSVVCVRYFGRAHLGQIRGTFSSATIAASSIGPFLLGITRDLTDSYEDILAVFAALAAIAFAAAFFATPPKRDVVSDCTDRAPAPDEPVALKEITI